ncbi:MAG: amino acid permease [Paludibacteraceae bacterium]|jgi:amino acid transporter|nr:amino acid permease [Paludibacteraceae bacterium]MBP9039380.1 amino acid permease [Paludibacteraceae bacterium]HHT61591.1 amino acid permease [Bacteroidales bacterium]
MSDVKKFGTSAVYFTALSTIVGAIVFLRFGYAVGSVGLWGTFILIAIGHLVTIPTALAISELATNKRVEGGGEYFIISRSFGLNIGATLGMLLYLSQTISVAFYIVAFTEAFDFLFNYLYVNFDFVLPKQVISIPAMILLSVLVLKKGANMGLKVLYIAGTLVLIALLMFFFGKPVNGAGIDYFSANVSLKNSGNMFLVLAIIFPAFTGITAGVGLSGDLKNPGKSIPIGTVAATFTGLILYLLICLKFANSALPKDLVENQLIMANIAIGGKILIPLGLAACTFTSALSSIMVGPRTLQALALDNSLPIKSTNKWLRQTRKKDNEPINASLVTCVIALVFVAFGSVDSVAQIISMFFLVTYGSLCLISFLHHFGSSPAYRPTFKSKWYISLAGFVISVWAMFQISVLYTLIAYIAIIGLYIYIERYHSDRKGFSAIFANTLFQMNRGLQIYLQNKRKRSSSDQAASEDEWRPSAICISRNTFKRDSALKLLNWISYKYGFGTYLHLIDGYYSKKTTEQAKIELDRLLSNLDTSNQVYIDTLISPSTTSAIAQSIQTPGIAGMENNMVIFEYMKSEPENDLNDIMTNFRMVNAGGFDVCILGTSRKPILYKNGIHIWVSRFDTESTNLMILLGFIIMGHPSWKKANIKIFNICYAHEIDEIKQNMYELINSGRMPITETNIEIIERDEHISVKEIINQRSIDAGLTMIGFNENTFKVEGDFSFFEGFENIGNVLFVHSNGKKTIN